MKKSTTLLSALLPLVNCLFAQTNITGTVRNAHNEPLPGVTIQVRDAPVGTTTNNAGAFFIRIMPGQNILIFKLLGHKTLELDIAGKTVVDVVLEESASGLDEVLVIGFGEQSKRRITGAISSVNEEAFENVSVPVFQRALQGQMPGVVLTNASGGLDAESIIRIRGTGSISAGNQPLIVVDGIILSDRPGSWTMGYPTNPFVGINANDIASVEVLKDAAAAAIYGSRGSNGVILVTTKTGAYYRRPKVNIGYYAGFSEITKRYDLLDGPEYAALFNAAVINAGGDSSWLYSSPATEPSTDWQDLLLRKGFVQELNVSVSGGTPSSKYYVGATFRDEDAYLRTIGLKRYSLRVNFGQRLGEKVSLGLSFNPSRVVDQRAGNQFKGSAFGRATWFSPNVNPYDENGDITRDEIVTSNGWEWGTANPVVVLKDQWILLTTSKMLTNANLSWAILPKLRFRSDFGVEFNQEVESRKFGKATDFGYPDGWADELNQQVFNYNWSNQLDWSIYQNHAHEMAATFGMQLARESFHGSYAEASSFPDDRFTGLGYAARGKDVNSWTTESAFVGWFARVNYEIKSKYLLDFTARYDGSSRFGSENRYGFFPAFAAGWILSEEPFFKIKGIDFLKLRSSIGLTGNADIGDFTYRSFVNYGPEYLEQPGFIIQSLENESLTWEKNLQWDAGMDFGFWKNRLHGSIDYFIKKTRDLLLGVPVPATNGVSFLTQNVGRVRNQGFEFLLAADVLRGNFQWTIQVNGATLKNEILKLADNDRNGADDDFVTNSRMLYRTGQSIGSFFLVEYAGVNPANGDALFYNLMDSIVTTASASSRKIVGKAIPYFTGGFTNTFRFKNFDLSVFFHFKTGHKIYVEHDQLYIGHNMASSNNQLKSQLNAWTGANPSTDVPQARLFVTNGSQPSTRYLEEANYLRLNHLTFGYTFNKLGRWETALRVFAAAQNLLTITGFSSPDPDVEFYSPDDSGQGAVRYNLPSARTYTFGFDMNF